VRIELPPLNRRREDIPLLVEHFIRQFNLKRGKKVTGVSDEVMRLLMNHPFTGNVRELENTLEHAFVICHENRIEMNHLPSEMLIRQANATPSIISPLSNAEGQAIRVALDKNKGNRAATARELGVSYATLWRKMKKLGIT
jgi:DNA-binding NtrC family response regulator